MLDELNLEVSESVGVESHLEVSGQVVSPGHVDEWTADLEPVYQG